MNSLTSDTITAIATPLGVGGIAVIRISGPQAFLVTGKITKIKKFKKNTIQHTALYDCQKKQKIDQVVVSIFKAPNSYTGEDIIEINCHGSLYLAKKVLEETIKAGARLAKPGEFTKRAFLAGKIDLTQVEAVSEMIGAKTDLSAQLALKHLEGNISREIKNLRQEFLKILGLIEASIDFPEEISGPSIIRLKSLVNAAHKKIDSLLKNSNQGILIREGINIVLAGRANVGKSSLFNLFCQGNKAIVHHIPGTTRDALEAEISLQGIKANLIDTAGLRQTKNQVETIGIEKSKEYLNAADLVLYLIDAKSGFTKIDREIITKTKNKNIIFVVNKIDLKPKIKIKNAVKISSKTGQGIKALEKKILKVMDLENLEINKNTYISSFRQKEQLIKVQETINTLQSSLNKKTNLDLVAIDIKNIIINLGEITGDEVSEETINYIFANFCVGK